MQAFSCEFCEIFKNTLFHRTFPVAASVHVILSLRTIIIFVLICRNLHAPDFKRFKNAMTTSNKKAEAAPKDVL